METKFDDICFFLCSYFSTNIYILVKSHSIPKRDDKHPSRHFFMICGSSPLSLPPPPPLHSTDWLVARENFSRRETKDDFWKDFWETGCYLSVLDSMVIVHRNVRCRCIPYHFKLLQMLPRYFQTSNPSTSIGDIQSSWRVKKCRSSFDICTSPIIHLHLPPKLCISIVICFYGDHYNSPQTSKTNAKQSAKQSFVGQWELCKLRLA